MNKNVGTKLIKWLLNWYSRPALSTTATLFANLTVQCKNCIGRQKQWNLQFRFKNNYKNMKHITHKNVHSFCRTCLAEFGVPHAGCGEKKYNMYLINDICQWLEACTSLTISKNDGYPKFLCKECYEKLEHFQEFRSMSVHSMSILVECLSATSKETDVIKDELYERGGSQEEVHVEQEDMLSELYGNRDWMNFQNEVLAKKDNGVMSALLESEAFPTDLDKYKDAPEGDTEIEIYESKLESNDAYEVELLNPQLLEGPNESNELDQTEVDIYDNFVTEESEESKNYNDFVLPIRKAVDLIEIVCKESSNTDSSISVTNAFAKRGRSCKRELSIGTSEKKAKIKYQCDICPRRCNSQQNLDAHKRTHEGLRPFPCKICDRSFNKSFHLRTHMRENHAESQKEIPCSFQGCDKVFRRDATFKMHCRLKHSDPRPNSWKTYMCEDCGRIFKNITALREHRYKHVPEEEYPYLCEHCNKRYTSQRTYKEHLLRHAGIKNFECPHCGMKKTTRNELRTHINYHTKEKQWPCPLCSSVFNSSANLGMHDRVVHKGIRRFACRFCEQSFGKPDTLKHHEMRHTGEKPNQCSVCNKRFIQLVALKAHMKTHDKPKKKEQPLTKAQIQNNADLHAEAEAASLQLVKDMSNLA